MSDRGDNGHTFQKGRCTRCGVSVGERSVSISGCTGKMTPYAQKTAEAYDPEPVGIERKLIDDTRHTSHPIGEGPVDVANAKLSECARDGGDVDALRKKLAAELAARPAVEATPEQVEAVAKALVRPPRLFGPQRIDRPGDGRHRWRVTVRFASGPLVTHDFDAAAPAVAVAAALVAYPTAIGSKLTAQQGELWGLAERTQARAEFGAGGLQQFMNNAGPAPVGDAQPLNPVAAVVEGCECMTFATDAASLKFEADGHHTNCPVKRPMFLPPHGPGRAAAEDYHRDHGGEG